MRSARGHISRPPARIGKIITPGENHHTETCTAATEMAITATDKTNAIRRFRVMNCLVSWVRRVTSTPRTRPVRRRPFQDGGVTMMRAL
jgi:hypothetical protein